MTKQTTIAPEAIRADLRDLSFNLWWTWQPEARALWRSVGKALSRAVRPDEERNPVLIVRTLKAHHLRSLARSSDYVALHRRLLKRFRSEMRRTPRPVAAPMLGG